MSLTSENRLFRPEEHIVDLSQQPWQDLQDDHGHLLPGIRGKSGSVAEGSDGLQIGADLIELSPGASFPAHVHEGDHILYGVRGQGTVTINHVTYHFSEGSTFYIPAEYPHNVGTYEQATKPFLILALGHPHKHVSAKDRMTVVEDC